MRTRCYSLGIVVLLLALGPVSRAHAQSFGVELHNTVMPASGAMGGTSIARPQDVQSAIAGNPATLAQFYGTHFGTGGAWIEPTFNIGHRGNNVVPGVTPFVAKSEAEGSLLGGFGITQDLRGHTDLPITFGMGLYATAGAGISVRDVPASNSTSDIISVLVIANSVGVELTDRLSAGASIKLSTANLFGPFTGIAAQAYDYGLRGTLGMTYELGDATTLGAYYETKQTFNFDDAVRLQLAGGAYTQTVDINADLPRNIGFGMANDRLMCGRLLLACDVLYKNWEDTDLFGELYEDQWALQFGSQYSPNDRIRLRAGYVYAENITKANPGSSAGGVSPPGLENALQYIQAQLPAINQHRISAGVSVRDVLPGVDMDLFAGGAPEVSQGFGSLSFASLQGYWAGFGLTWRFARGHCGAHSDCAVPVLRR